MTTNVPENDEKSQVFIFPEERQTELKNIAKGVHIKIQNLANSKKLVPKNLDVRLRRCAGFHESQPGKELTSVSYSNLSPSPRSICLKHISKDIAKDISKDIAKTIIKSWKRTDFNIILKSLPLPPLHRF